MLAKGAFPDMSQPDEKVRFIRQKEPGEEANFKKKLASLARYLTTGMIDAFEQTERLETELDIYTVMSSKGFVRTWPELISSQQEQILKVIETSGLSIKIERHEGKIIDIIFLQANSQGETAPDDNDEEVEFSGICWKCKKVIIIRGRKSQATKRKLVTPKRGKDRRPYIDYDWPVLGECTCIAEKCDNNNRGVVLFYREYQK